MSPYAQGTDSPLSSPAGAPRRSSKAAEALAADDQLAGLGYEAELDRSRTTWQVAFMSFVLASVPYGLSTTLIYPLQGGGPVTIIWGWVAVCAIMLCVAASLGEITSVYPTAGGVYYQTFMVAPARYRRALAWVCGWAYTLGNITITLSVNFGTALFLIGCINIFSGADGDCIFPTQPYHVWTIFLGITLITNAISAFANRWLPLLDTAAIYGTFVGVVAIIATALAVAAEGRRSASYVFTGFEVSSGWVPGWAFCIGLLHAAYATSATGMIISMSEEVKHPTLQVPKAMLGATLLNAVCGFIFLVPLVFVLPDLAAVINDPTGQPLPVILRSAIGNEAGAFILCVPIIILGVICGTGCTTASSRCVWAFARDGAMPGSPWMKKIDRRLGIPANAMLVSMVVQLFLGLIYFGSSAAFNAFNGVGVIFLNLSYELPIAISFFRGRTCLKGAPFNLGAIGFACNIVAMAWILLVIPLFSMPSVLPVDVTSMNYASVVFVGGLVISAVYYAVHGRHHYEGPPTSVDSDMRSSSEQVRRSSHT